MEHRGQLFRWADRVRGAWSAVRGLVLTRNHLLALYLLGYSGNSLIFYLFAPTYYDRNIHLPAIVLPLLLMPLTVNHRPRHAYVVHTLTALMCVVLIYIASHTGGINSSTVVWLSFLPVPVLSLLGPTITLVWIGINEALLLGLFLATNYGWVAPQTHVSDDALPWTLLNHAMVLGSLMLCVRILEHLHLQQIRESENRNAELRSTHEALIRAQAHKDEFVAAVGHELRTPMNAILGFNGVLRQELADRPEQVEVVDHIRRSTMHLLQVVNDILDFSQLQAGRLSLHLSDFDLRELLQETLELCRSKAAEKGLGCDFQWDPALVRHVHGDRQRLQQVLLNLLDNAIKFTAQGQVSLRAWPTGERVRFEVEDSGRGIAPERQSHIFRRFEQADVQTHRAYGGTGLGLTLCERLVQLQGGEIGVRSQIGQGSLFWFELPLAAALQPVQQTPAMAPLPVDEALRILLVDDNEVNLMVARLQLQKIWPQSQVTLAKSGPQALRLLDVQAFDIALVDMIMPDMDGMQLTRQIRHSFPQLTARMPVIALTANTHPAERERCLQAGMDDVLHKPIETDKLVHSVNLLVAKARA